MQTTTNPSFPWLVEMEARKMTGRVPAAGGRRCAILLLFALGLLPAARAQVNLSVDPHELEFNVASGAVSAIQTVSVSTSVPTTVIVQVLSGDQWLTVQEGPVNVNGFLNLPVRVNASSLGSGIYSGSFRISTQFDQVTVSVTANVGGFSTLYTFPSTLTFHAQEGGLSGSPSAAVVQVLSNAGTLSYRLRASTDSGGNWLLLSTGGGFTGGPGFTVAVNPFSLTPGTYTGTVTVQSNTTADAVQVAVTLFVGSGATLSVSPAIPPTFLYQTGGTLPAPQNLVVSSTGGFVQFSVAESPNVSWLTVTPLNGTAGNTPATVTLSVNPAGLSPGFYSTNVYVTPQNGISLPAIPVRLAVSNSPLLQVSKTSLSFSMPFSGAAPPSQTFRITTSGTGTAGYYITSGASWLTATPSAGTAPATITVAVNPAGLAAGPHTASLIVRPSNGDPYFHEITVSFPITNPAGLTAGPGALLFSYQTGGNMPAPQTVALRSTGQPINFVLFAGTSNCGSGWLYATPSQSVTPATVSVGISTSGLPLGICSGTIEVSYDAGAGLEFITIPVTVAISEDPELRVTLPQGFGVITVQRGQSVAAPAMTLTSTSGTTQVNFSMFAFSNGGPWLVVPNSGVTPASVSPTIFSAGLSSGTYTGQIVVSSPSLAVSFTIPVTLQVLPEISVSVSPQSLAFSQAQGGSPSPPQTLTMTPTGSGATFQAGITQISGGNWLQIDRTSGSAAGDIQVSVKPNSLVTGTYSSRITLSFSNAVTSPIQIPVTLSVVSPQRISSSVSQLNFNYQIGSATPASQTFSITGSPGPSNFTVGTTSGGWLSVSAQSGTTPAQLTASVNVAGLATGGYAGSITITAPGAVGSPLIIPVTLTITGPPVPVITEATNNASNQDGPVSGGELLTLKGTFLPPEVPAALFTVTPPNRIGPLLNGVRVLFDGVPGAPVYVSRTQINVIAPYEILSRPSVSIVVEYEGVQSQPFNIAVAIAAPGIYTLDATGRGPAAALNSDGTFNGPGGNTRPALPGSTIVIYLTGGGQTIPASFSGTVTPTSPLYRIVGQVNAEIGGRPATVEFMGAAPGLATGIVQANLKPDPSVRGEVSVRVTINGVTSPAGPTVSIQ